MTYLSFLGKEKRQHGRLEKSSPSSASNIKKLVDLINHDLKHSGKFHVTMYDHSSVDEARLHLFALKREIVQLCSTNSGSTTETGKGNCISGKGTIKMPSV